LYKYLLEQYYGQWMYNDKAYSSVKVEVMQLIVVHDNHINHECKAVTIPDMKPIIDQMIQLRREELQAPNYIPLPID